MLNVEKKEKDLEIAARIGQSLLELNRELKTRNDFLEESLNSSNETIVQLRHELQLRTSLLHAYVENEDELDSHSKESVDGLQCRVKKLENENENLRAEAQHLKKLSSGLEEVERLHISECSRNLDLANEKINHLKFLLSEKGVECAAQNAEVERLMKIVAIQSSREKVLVTENADLREQIDETMLIYDDLSRDYAVLQEKYTEVLSMLHDADEELKNVRRTMSKNCSGSVDSLYDSLASELETSDSGLWSSVNSSRETRKTVEEKKFSCLQLELETARIEENQEDEHVPSICLPGCDAKDGDFEKTPCETQYDLSTPLASLSCPSSLLCCSADTHPSTSKIDIVQDSEDSFCPKAENCVGCSSFNCKAVELLKSSSDDSLESYEGPELGEPGKPGTRDLDFSLRKRGIRQEIEQEYARFRQQRGLSPLKFSFFSVPFPEIKLNTFKCTGMEQLLKWKRMKSKGLADPLGESNSEMVVSRVSYRSLPNPSKTSLLTENAKNSEVGSQRLIQHLSYGMNDSGLFSTSRSFLPRKYDKFSSRYLHIPNSSSLVGSLSSNDSSVKQLKSGIITRMMPSV
uniref:HAP1 N-terminal domain-containing protein n=1 Tax=Syphacia muris TaxID=451379 RepID=A0A0N5AYI5_9BILA